MAGKFILETERLLLREFDEGDVAPFYLMGSDPAVLRHTGDPGGGLTSVEHALEVLRSRPIADYRNYGYGRWACVLKASGEVIGFAGLKYLADLQEVDIGYRLLPAYWGQGWPPRLAGRSWTTGAPAWASSGSLAWSIRRTLPR
jgi:RimJ/RimL family protein N-acetyltransferase